MKVYRKFLIWIVQTQRRIFLRRINRMITKYREELSSIQKTVHHNGNPIKNEELRWKVSNLAMTITHLEGLKNALI